MHRPARVTSIALAILALTWLAASPAQADSPQRPNFVFLLVDDLGWADVGCYGSEFYETPHIDALAASGMKFMHGYTACPVCSPTRASIMTGRHPVRVDITDWIPGMRARPNMNPRFLHVDDRDELALEEVTIAEALKEHDYQNFFAGKWHLGDEGFWPTDQGFDFNIGGNHKGSPPGGYYAPWDNPTLTAKMAGEYLTERLTDESIDFLNNRDAEKPFFLMLSYYNVHTPVTPYEKRVEHYRAKKEATIEGPTPTLKEREAITRLRQDNADYASMVAAVDDSVGRLLETLKELKLEENTVVIFFSDNGGLSTVRRMGPTSNLPLRSGKGWLYEGGVRVPTIIRAPGVTTANTTTDAPMVSMDFFPTMLELAGLPLAPKLHADGESLVSQLRGEKPSETRTFYWHYPHYHGSTWTPGASIRDGDWKLIEFYETDEVELFDLAKDPGEQTDLSESKPEVTTRLREKLRTWQKEMNAKMPQPNPDWVKPED